MAITAMVTVKNTNNIRLTIVAALLPLVIAPAFVLAGDWTFTPSLGLDETYTDNVELTITEPTSSFVTQAIAGLDANYKSRVASLTISGTESYAMYSHDSVLNDNYRTLDASGQYFLWIDGLAIVANAQIANQSRNKASNSLADLVSGDTVETENYSTGLQYNFDNSSYSLQSSITYSITRAEDGIGESDGFSTQLSSENGNNARLVYWQLSGQYTKREQELGRGANNNGENYTVNALIGAITSWNFNPFIRFYDEEVKGSGVAQDLQTSSSWGPGIRWLASPHLVIDLSYNIVAEENASDDYIAASLQWQPSARTSLMAGYSQRFFGDSYNLEFQHKTKRLSNSVSYNEILEVFDRNSYKEVSPEDIELVKSNEFSVNKHFTWSSKLKLSRTSFDINVSAKEREGLETGIVDDNFDASLAISRKIGTKSSLSLLAKYNYLIFDKDNPEGSRQEDQYKTFSATHTRDLTSSLSSYFTVQHVNRDSTVDRYSYDEVRVVINITKDF